MGINPVICSVLEVLTDLGTRKLKSSVQDNLVLTEEGEQKIKDTVKPSEPAELWVDLRRQHVQLTNPAYKTNLVERTWTVLNNNQIHKIYQAYVDEHVRKQLEGMLTGQVQGWGSADRDNLFTKTGGEKFASDSWH